MGKLPDLDSFDRRQIVVRGEKWLGRIVRSQTLAQIATQLNDGNNRTVSKRTEQRSFTVWVLEAVDLREYHCSMLAILPGKESTEIGV
ncbi:hypothetical protein TNCV_2661671 [Trichonephila clavipes]|nr:hypothetical protein TNCV_2661671 [Trichonephila clavipes]